MGFKKSRLKWVVAALASCLAVVFITTESRAGKAEIILAVGGERPEGYDPTLGWGDHGNPLFQSTLLKRDENLEIVPDLAVEWTLSQDRLTWTIRIRDDVLFTDGSPLTAEDVAYTFNTAAASGGILDLSYVDRAEALDKTTVSIRLKRPDITFFHYFVTLGIVPRRLHTADYRRNPVGSGPYKMVRWDEGQQMILEINDRYYGPRPAFKRLVFLFTEPDAGLAAARAGKVDVLLVPSSLARQNIAGMTLHAIPSVDNRGLMFPVVPDAGKRTPRGLAIGNDVTADLAIRRAVNHAIDRKALVEGVLEGFGSPAFGVVDGLPWDNPDIRFQDGDLKKAAQILEAGGWVDSDGDGVREKNGLKAEFVVVYDAKDSLRQGLASAAADMVRPVGIKIVPRGEGWDRIRDELCHSHVILFGYGDHSPLEMYKLYHSSPGPEPMYWNPGFYSNPVVDRYLDQAKAAPSFDAAIPFWRKAQWDGQTGFTTFGDAAWAWMVNLKHTYFVNKCLDVSHPQIEPHGGGWQITANITQWKWVCD
ncbi:MAG: ABC transporter substrate-binding protein [Proteobacteria bacterium]|nr:ABC transporter substrate-binding protein [Pseudomonadota bacterium]